MSGFVFDPARDAAGNGESPTPPRDLVDRPEMFGRWGKPMRAAVGTDPADARFIAANLQHWVANAVREEVLLQGTNLASFLPTLTLTSAESSFERIMRLQRGEEPMRLTDLLMWARNIDAVAGILASAFGDTARASVVPGRTGDGGMGPVRTTGRAVGTGAVTAAPR